MECSERELVSAIGESLSREGSKVSVAESCTGGLVGCMLTSIPGSSDWFAGGVIAYMDSIKVQMLGVDQDSIDRFGAASEEVVSQMALGIRSLFRTDFSIAISGIAGPGGATPCKPVGTVWFSICSRKKCHAERMLFTGGRETVRRKSALHLLSMLHQAINEGN